jgi:hypothetical protein
VNEESTGCQLNAMCTICDLCMCPRTAGSLADKCLFMAPWVWHSCFLVCSILDSVMNEWDGDDTVQQVADGKMVVDVTRT